MHRYQREKVEQRWAESFDNEIQEWRKMVKAVPLGSEERLSYLRLSHQSFSQKLPAITAMLCCSHPNTMPFSVVQPSPIDKSKTKVTTVFTQPLAQITSSKRWPAGCTTLSVRVNDLAGCRPTERGETQRTRKQDNWGLVGGVYVRWKRKGLLFFFLKKMAYMQENVSGFGFLPSTT